ncbi:cohesin domain-containing protein [Candidatus Sumerlaeota bacterium]
MAMRQISQRFALTLATGLIFMLAAAPGLAVQLSLQDAQAPKGSTVQVALNVDEGLGVAGVQATINYDSAVLQNPVVTVGSHVQGHQAYYNVPTAGQLRTVVYANPTADFSSGAGTVAFITFSVAGDAPLGDTALSFEPNPAPGFPGAPSTANLSASDSTGAAGQPTPTSVGAVVTITTSSKWYFAEGSTEGSNQTYLLVVNPHPTETANLNLTVLFPDISPLLIQDSVPPLSRFTFNMGTRLSAAGVNPNAFAMVLDSGDVEVYAERAFYWSPDGDYRAGGTDASGSKVAATTWYLAEGSTSNNRVTKILVGNPSSTTATLSVRYLIQGEGPTTIQHEIGANRRYTIDALTDIGEKDFSTEITSDQDIVVERTMYGTANGVAQKWGHTALGRTQRSDTWYLAEGAAHFSGSVGQFETFILMANTSDTAVTANLTFLMPDGSTVEKTQVLAANRRTTIRANNYPEIDGVGGFSTVVKTTGDEPILVERAMYWRPGTFTDRAGATAVFGSPSLGTSWYLPEGATGGTSQFENFILIGNPSASEDADVTVTFIRSDGVTYPVQRTVLAGQRVTVKANDHVEQGVSATQSISTEVVVTSGPGVVVERAMYWQSGSGVSRIEGHASGGIIQ